jgi:hypothetical protein
MRYDMFLPSFLWMGCGLQFVPILILDCSSALVASIYCVVFESMNLLSRGCRSAVGLFHRERWWRNYHALLCCSSLLYFES